MEQDLIETVLSEILEEQKQTNLLNRENTQALLEQGKKLNAIEKKLESKPLVPVADTKQIERVIAEGINKITAIAADEPRQVIHQKRILLFPEYNAKEYYKIVFGRIIGWMVLLVIARLCFLLIEQSITVYQQSNEYRQAYEKLLMEQQVKPKKSMVKAGHKQDNIQ